MNVNDELKMFCDKQLRGSKPSVGASLIGILMLCFGAVSLFGQQDVQYTQFMHNKMAFNSSVAGSKGVPVVAGLIRQQWFDVEGAPASQSITFHSPIPKRKIGLGLVLTNDEIGVTRSSMISANYAYHIQLKEELFLSAGLNTSLRQFSINWDEAIAIHPDDIYVPANGENSKMMMNFGAGLLLYNDNLYAGISAPRLLRNRIDFGVGISDAEALSREEVHVYAMAGTLLPLKGKLSLKPALLMKYVNNAPVDFDLHASLDWNRFFSVGATYRTGGSIKNSIGESIDVLLGFSPNQKLRLGVSYDYSLTKINQYTPGSGELFVEYVLERKADKLTNPRFF